MEETLTPRNRLLSGRGVLLFMILIFLAGWLRFYDLGEESLWMDEAVSENFVKSDVLHIVKTSGHFRNNPPLYWVILHYWVRVFGNGEGALRAPSALFGIAAVLMMFRVGRELFDSRTAFLGMILCAVSQFQVYYSQDARPYSLLVFLSLASYLFFLKLIKPDPRRSDYVLYAFSSIALGYTHVYGIFIMASQISYLVIRGRSCEYQRYAFWCTFGFIMASLLPLALILGPSTQKIASEGFWIQRPSLLMAAGILKQFVSGKNGGFVLGALCVVLALLGLLGSRIASIQWRSADSLGSIATKRGSGMAESGDKNLLLLLWLSVSIIVPFIISQITTPILVPRYVIGVSPPSICL